LRRPLEPGLSDCTTVRQRPGGCLSSMLVGYMRISTADERQSVDLQRDALQVAGVDERHLHEIVCPELAMTAPASRPASPI
jgi:hypothetical protein